jgi:hypothetical protein
MSVAMGHRMCRLCVFVCTRTSCYSVRICKRLLYVYISNPENYVMWTLYDRPWTADFAYLIETLSVRVAARSKSYVCGRFLVGDCGFESHGVHGYKSLVSVVCCQVEVSTTANHLFRAVLPKMVWMSVIEKPHRGDQGPLGAVHPWKQEKEKQT